MARETAGDRKAMAEGLVVQWLATARAEPGFYGPRTPVQAVNAMRDDHTRGRWDETLRALGLLHHEAVRRAIHGYAAVDSRWMWEDFDAWHSSGKVPARIVEDDARFAEVRKARVKREAGERLAAARDAKAPRSRSATVRGYWLAWRRGEDASEVVVRGERLRANDPLVQVFVGGVLARRDDQRVRRISEDRLGTVTVVFQHRTGAPLRWNDVAFAFDRAADEVLGPTVAPPRASGARPAESSRAKSAPREVEPFALTAPEPPKRKPEQLGLFGRVSGLLNGGR